MKGSAKAKADPGSASLLDQYGFDRERTFTVQQTAELTGLSEHTLRYYERIGLITPILRDSNSRHRRYWVLT